MGFDNAHEALSTALCKQKQARAAIASETLVEAAMNILTPPSRA